jgi:hypothetical protein
VGNLIEASSSVTLNPIFLRTSAGPKKQAATGRFGSTYLKQRARWPSEPIEEAFQGAALGKSKGATVARRR